MNLESKQSPIEKAPKFEENIDYYFENGLMILTEHFLKKRGYCCKNGCRHCPYQENQENQKNQKTEDIKL